MRNKTSKRQSMKIRIQSFDARSFAEPTLEVRVIGETGAPGWELPPWGRHVLPQSLHDWLSSDGAKEISGSAPVQLQLDVALLNPQLSWRLQRPLPPEDYGPYGRR
jgi:hypothetical protein